MKLRAAGVLAGLTLSLALGACAGHTTTSPPQSPAASQNYSSAYTLGEHDAQSDLSHDLGPAGQSAAKWCDLQLYGGAGVINGGNSAAWFAGCQVSVTQGAK